MFYMVVCNSYFSEIIEMERRANAILNGRRRNNFPPAAASLKSKPNDISLDVKKNKHTFSLTKKGNNQETNIMPQLNGIMQQSFMVKNRSKSIDTLSENAHIVINAQKSSTERGTSNSGFLLTGISSTSGKNILSS